MVDNEKELNAKKLLHIGESAFWPNLLLPAVNSGLALVNEHYSHLAMLLIMAKFTTRHERRQREVPIREPRYRRPDSTEEIHSDGT
jgi:hypothetical protein